MNRSRAAFLLAAVLSAPACAFADTVEQTIIALDTAYQAAVKNNDAAGMARILADDFVLITGKGAQYSKAQLLEQARSGQTVYEKQDSSRQSVRVWGDTAVITALLTAKGIRAGKPIEAQLWFSDVYIRRGNEWKYVLGQAAQPLAQ